MSAPAKDNIDYSLYLVTDRSLPCPTPTFEDLLEKSIVGGVTVVQLREKTADSREFLQTARVAADICRSHGVPLLINDRPDIACLLGSQLCAGVHLGQSDTTLGDARRLLWPGAVLGLSVSTVQEAREALDALDGWPDYFGIGPVWATATKKNHKPPLGPRGVRRILEVVEQRERETGRRLPCVAIGAVARANAGTLLDISRTHAGRALDGVAVVSAIVTSPNPENDSRLLRQAVRAGKLLASREVSPPNSSRDLKSRVKDVWMKARTARPVVQQITNTVVQNFSANVTIAVGASPIMSGNAGEADDLAALNGALLINIGTLTEEQACGMLACGKLANVLGKPVVLDPVACGATSLRASLTADLLNTFSVSILKGNAAEISALVGVQGATSRGVDSEGEISDPVKLVGDLARRERCVVVMTGVKDYISDGVITVVACNGHEMLGKVTGTGCSAGSCMAAYAAASENDHLAAALTGCTVMNVAGELAALRPDVKGPGTFASALLDELYNLQLETLLERMRAEIVDVFE